MPLPTEKIYTETDYYNLPEDIRVELINGQIYNQAAPSRIHQEILMFLSKLIANYIDSKGGSCKVYPAPFAVKLSEDNKTIVEPDISVICDHSKLTDKGCTGAPDLIIEIVSQGNLSHDYITKLGLYKAAGVREYWIVNPMKKSIYVYFFEEQAFDASSFTLQDKVKVNIYEDLYIDFSAISI
jgi:Uma2 family endonuclease